MFAGGYGAYKRHVRLLANLAGIPDDLEPDGAYRITTTIWWKSRARIDSENVQKATIDGLFKRDRRVLEVHAIAHESSGKECAHVKIERVR